MVYSRFLLFPFLRLISNTPLSAFPYSAGKAPVIKSLLESNCELMIIIPPPLLAALAKWLGFGISMPSILQSKPLGELPRIEILLLPSLVLTTPAKDETIRAGSFTDAANFCVSSTENERALTVAISFRAWLFEDLAVISTSSMV